MSQQQVNTDIAWGEHRVAFAATFAAPAPFHPAPPQRSSTMKHEPSTQGPWHVETQGPSKHQFQAIIGAGNKLVCIMADDSQCTRGDAALICSIPAMLQMIAAQNAVIQALTGNLERRDAALEDEDIATGNFDPPTHTLTPGAFQ